MSATAVAAALAAVFAAALALLRPPADPELFWRLALGEWILGHARLLDQDMFSFTRAGVPYHDAQSLADVVVALAYRAGGWLGIALLRAALVATGAFFAGHAVFRAQRSVPWGALPLAAALTLIVAVARDESALFTIALFPIAFDVLLASQRGHPARLVWLPPLFLVWANLDGGFVAGLALAAIFVAERAIRTRRRADVSPFAFAFAASAVATLANPAGVGALARAVSYAVPAGGPGLGDTPLDVLLFPGFVVAAFAVVAFALALALGRERVDALAVGSSPLWGALVVAFTLGALATERNAALAGIVSAPFVAAALPAALGRAARPAPDASRGLVLGAAVVALAIAIVALVTAPRAADLATYPTGAIAALEQSAGRLLNEPDWGGYLMRAAPSHPVFIDGRDVAFYGDDVVASFADAVRVRPAYASVLDRWQIAVALLRPSRPLAVALRDDGWRVLASGPNDTWVLLARP